MSSGNITPSHWTDKPEVFKHAWRVYEANRWPTESISISISISSCNFNYSNINLRMGYGTSMSDLERIEKTVDYLTYKLQTKRESTDFLFWAAHRLPDPVLMRFAVKAKELGRNPGAYFNSLVMQEVKKRGLV